MLFNKTNELRARIGAGSGIYTSFFQDDNKYALLVPSIQVPFIGNETSEIEVRVANSDEVTKLGGIKTYQAGEADVYMHRDCIKLLNQVDGKVIPLLFVAGDFSAQKCNCLVTYTKSNLEQENAWQGTLKFTPKTAPEDIENAYPLIKPTAFFTSNIDDTVWFDKATASHTIELNTKYDDTTITAKADDTTIVTANVAEKKLTLTPLKVGSTIVRLTTAKEGYASWETSILVIVEALKA